MSSAPRPARVCWTGVRTPLGKWLVAATDRGLCLLCLDQRRGARRLAEWVARWEPGAEISEDADALAAAAAALRGYARGEESALESLELDLRGSEFQLAVWEALVRIPWGTVSSYGEVARAVGRPEAARAVGGAAGANPLPVVVPCHRVVAENGLGGFTGGLDQKRLLLAHEGFATQRSLW